MEPAAAPVQEPPSSKTKWIIAGCCGCALVAVLFFALVGGGAFIAAASLTAPAKQDARAFLADVEKGDLDAAYAHLSKPLQAELPKEKLKAMAESKPELFKVAGDPTYTSMNFENGQVHLQGSFTNKAGTQISCKFDYIQEGGAWKMLGFNITP
jgi:hypothetical protein